MNKKATRQEMYEFSESLLADALTLRLPVGGGSMFPLLRPNDIILTKKCPIGEINKYDVVVFKRADQWIAHRVIKTHARQGKTVLLTQGDSCRANDEPLENGHIVGKVIGRERNGKQKSLRYSRTGNLYRKMGGRTMNRLLFNISSRTSQLFHLVIEVYHSLLFISSVSRRRFFLNLLLAGLLGILPFVSLWFVKILFDVLATHIHTADSAVPVGFSILYLYIAFAALSFLVTAFIQVWSIASKEKFARQIAEQMMDRIHRKHASLDLGLIENTSSGDKIHRAMQEGAVRPGKMMLDSVQFVQSVTAFGVIAMLLWYLHPAVFFLILLAVFPGVISRLYYARALYRMNVLQSQAERRALYFSRVITGGVFAAELRLLELGHFFSKRYKQLRKQLSGPREVLIRKKHTADAISQGVAISITFISFAWVVAMAVQGRFSPGTVVLFFMVFQRGYAVLRDIFSAFSGLIENQVYLHDYFEFLELPSQTPATAIQSLPMESHDICLKHVSFSYPGSQTQAIHDVSLHIPAGKTIALVGPNGSGKTTLMKLLCAFYYPGSGQILYDGQDITTLNPASLRKQITAVFQDFALYYAPAQENIRFGNTETDFDEEKIRQAAQQAGILDVLDALPGGLATPLGSRFDNGVELSVGQWQKMAIARAFYRNAPMLFMDEPSSAIDPVNEQEIIDNLLTLGRQKTVVIISHRLSTVRRADVIYVLKNGGIAEQGNHAELMEKQGEYFQMYQSGREI